MRRAAEEGKKAGARSDFVGASWCDVTRRGRLDITLQGAGGPQCQDELRAEGRTGRTGGGTPRSMTKSRQQPVDTVKRAQQSAGVVLHARGATASRLLPLHEPEHLALSRLYRPRSLRV